MPMLNLWALREYIYVCSVLARLIYVMQSRHYRHKVYLCRYTEYKCTRFSMCITHRQQ